MVFSLTRTILIFSFIFLVSSPASTADIISNDTVLEMVKLGLGESLIISKIKSSDCKCDISLEEILTLKKEGVGENIIQAMIESTSEKAVTSSWEDVDYQNAIAFAEYEKYDEAIDILKELADRYVDFKYHYSLIDAMTEKCWAMKEANEPEWESRIEALELMIKKLYIRSRSNPDYWLIYSKFSGLTKKSHRLNGGLEKAFYYKPDYAKAYLVKGDIYFHLAKKPLSGTSGGASFEFEYDGAETAREAYKRALGSGGLSLKEKTLVLYKLGVLELYAFRNTNKAMSYWRESAALSPDNRWTLLSRERLAKIQ